MNTLENALGLLYLRNISATFQPPLEKVPNYLEQTIPFFLVLIALELCLLVVRKVEKSYSLNDTICSLAQGLQSQIVSVLFKGVEVLAYIYVWTNFRLINIAWDSTYAWIFTMIGVDFGYYLFHRFAHECNLVWASHQVHHSSEYYNLSTALRQSMFQHYFSWIFYLPLAFCGIAPSMFLAHAQFNTIYQFWIHTEVIDKLGPLELILNTPSHHRVHHGSNVKYLDKNYGGVLIIWDRLFGTFCPEQERPTYGLVHNVESYDLWKVQLCHYWTIISEFQKQEGWSNKFKRIFFGPGWNPGSQRLGNTSDVPEPDKTRNKFDSSISIFVQMYVVVHLLLTSLIIFVMTQTFLLTANTATLLALMVTSNLTTIGWLMDNSSLGSPSEFIRCLTVAIVVNQWSRSDISWISNAKTIVVSIMLMSTIIWPIFNRNWMQIAIKKLKIQ